jgi:hypothetical protein
MKIEVYKAKNGQWYWRLMSSNRHVLATSETYTRKFTAMRIARNVGKRLGATVVVPNEKPAPRKRAAVKRAKIG